MPRTLKFVVRCASTLIFCLPGHAQQDSPSLGDLARQAQKTKSMRPPRKSSLMTTFPPARAPVVPGPVGGLGGGLGQAAQGSPSAKQDAPASPFEALDKLQTFVDQFAGLDRAAPWQKMRCRATTPISQASGR